jgi:hypothetical protein
MAKEMPPISTLTAKNAQHFPCLFLLRFNKLTSANFKRTDIILIKAIVPAVNLTL